MIEENIILGIKGWIEDNSLFSNFGTAESVLILGVLLLENKEIETEWMSYVGKKINRVLLRDVDRDGFGEEISMGYNAKWLNSMNEMAEMTVDMPEYNLYNNPKVKLMYKAEAAALPLGKFSLGIGDHGSSGSPGIIVEAGGHIPYYLVSRDVTNAQLIDLAMKYRPGRLERSIFTNYDDFEKNLAADLEKYGPYRYKSVNFASFGFSSAATENSAVSIFYGHRGRHGHDDPLNLYLHAYNIDLLPDNGYPDDFNIEAKHWTESLTAHNTVMVNRRLCTNMKTRKVYKVAVGRPIFFDVSGRVRTIEVDYTSCYKWLGVNLYRRALISLPAKDGEGVIILDVFRIRGGEEYHYSFHAAGTDVVCRGIEFAAQNGGTYAGEDVSYKSAEYDKNNEDGLNYLYDIERAEPKGKFSIDWKINDFWERNNPPRDIHVRATVIGGAEKAALAKGQPSQTRRNPEYYRYLICEKSGDSADFVSVIEAYEGEASLGDAEILRFDDEKIEVKLIYADGSEEVLEYFFGGREVYHGEVVDFTRELSDDNFIKVRLDEDDADIEKFAGRIINIDNTRISNGAYNIISAEKTDDGCVRIDVGDRTTIDDLCDDGSFVYNIEAGQRFEIRVK